jgi:hypothetical protein
VRLPVATALSARPKGTPTAMPTQLLLDPPGCTATEIPLSAVDERRDQPVLTDYDWLLAYALLNTVCLQFCHDQRSLAGVFHSP